MSSVNKVILIGNLGADPEARYTANGRAVTNFRMATTERFNDRDGNLQERTEWHRVVVWGKQAESCKSFLSKGKQVYVEGKLQTREWAGQDGNKRYTTEIVADQVVFLSGPSRQGDGGRQDQWGGGGGMGSGSGAGAGGNKTASQRGDMGDDSFYNDGPGNTNSGGFQGGGGNMGMGQFPGDADEEDVPF